MSLDQAVDAALRRWPQLLGVRARLLEYLDPQSPKPLALGVSGGGDSLALMVLARHWLGRPLEVFCVDHGLNPNAGLWSQQVETYAKALGCAFHPLVWSGPKPTTALQAKAREARFRLISEAMRAQGIAVLALGHNRNDIEEARWMRAEGSSVSEPRPWGPMPLWPEGRGQFCLRPLLECQRHELRGFLKDLGLSYIEDPSNDNPQFLRVKARKALGLGLGSELSSQPIKASEISTTKEKFSELMRELSVSRFGGLSLDVNEFLNLERAMAHRLMAGLVVCASGRAELPRQASIERLIEALRAGTLTKACLKGAYVMVYKGRLWCVRDHDDQRQAKSTPQSIKQGQALVYDGRLEITGLKNGFIWPWALAKRFVKSRLSLGARQSLVALDKPFLNESLVFFHGEEAVGHDLSLNDFSIINDHDYGIKVKPLGYDRLRAYLGVIDQESLILDQSL